MSLLIYSRAEEGALGTEDDPIVGSLRAREGASGVVLRVGERLGAQPLKVPRLIGGEAPPSPAAVLGRLVDGARVVAAAGGPEVGGALGDDVGRAPDGLGAAVGGRGHLKGDVEAVDEGDVVVVLVGEVVEAVLCLGERRGAVGGAVELASAVSGEAGAAAGGVEGAVGAGPDSGQPGPVGEVEGPGLPAVKAAAAPVGEDGGPEGVGAVVFDVEADGGGREEEEEWEEDEEEVGFHGCLFVWFELKWKWKWKWNEVFLIRKSRRLRGEI
ncbi:hypothetical protein SASPL_131016 [Salvia splendens]|uniref:Uncharacterized protein n=1 Tax=Salvia splendens TaxID=180675 RepID=A0A8X8ZL68_SALSN|nr:hypothetical protein SASPL_131016 [Salvia splendens]